jgi:hypothetical protein
MPVPQKSRFWQQLPKAVRRDLQRKPVTMENHSYGAPYFHQHVIAQPIWCSSAKARSQVHRIIAQHACWSTVQLPAVSLDDNGHFV